MTGSGEQVTCPESRSDASILAVVVNWNGSSQTLRCVEALRNSVPRPRVLVVDNGSTHTEIDLLARTLPKSELLCLGRNLGFGAAINVAATVRRKHETFLLMLNNDVIMPPDALKVMMDALETPLDLVAPFLEGRDGALESPLTVNRMAGSSYPYLKGACVLIDFDHFAALDGYNTRYFHYFEDSDLCRRAVEAGGRLVVAPTRVVHLDGATLPASSPLAKYYLHRNAIGFVAAAKQWSVARTVICAFSATTLRQGIGFRSRLAGRATMSNAVLVATMHALRGNWGRGPIKFEAGEKL